MNKYSDNVHTTSNKFHFENGRRFHNVEDSTYFLPNDDEECDRLHFQHFLERYVWQNNFSAPVKDLLNQKGAMVLDVGTGAGSWLFEMATNFPKAHYIGIDISPVQPGYIKPKNVRFIEANVLETLPFDNNKFDYIFQRILYVGIPGNKWSSVINELVRVLKPDGYLELQGLLENNEQLHKVHYEIKTKCDSENCDKLCKLSAENYITALATMKPKLMTTIDVSSNEYDDLVKTMEKELIELESFTPRVRVYAQKKFISG
ncbi:9133_t:CDS:2 [Scutellospora calospora]|uniref:9133_t:CDS:1 n=1 Tax=Scutellospora calospora TaxID=85575 RepID=A0ACA9KE13_9GLOM|nr:9133_t:CDS:2 [Scutellospora calospora]